MNYNQKPALLTPNHSKLTLRTHAPRRLAEDAVSRRRPMEPGHYLIRLRLQYGHKGLRPLARIP